MTGFLGLPGEIRNMIYRQLLMLEEPINFLRSRLETAILYTNKTIYRESSSLLYGQNCFDSALFPYELLSKFLGQIGPSKAGYIQHVRIHFPFIRGHDHVTLSDDGTCILAKIQSDCINLKTITISPAKANYLALNAISYFGDDLKFVTEALSITITRLRDFPSVEKIIGEVYDHGSSAFIRKEMDRLGCVVRTVVPPEDRDDHRHFGDSVRDDIMRLTVIATPGEEPQIGLEFTFGEKAQGGWSNGNRKSLITSYTL